MTKPLRLAAEAKKEILEAAVWYERERPGLGEAFVAAVDEALTRVARLGPECRPAIGVRPELGVRRVLVRRFPYLVTFEGSGGAKTKALWSVRNQARAELVDERDPAILDGEEMLDHH